MEAKQNAPRDVAASQGGKPFSPELGKPSLAHLPDPGKIQIKVQVCPPDGPVILIPGGRKAQTMRLLLAVGSRGFTKGEASPYGWARHTGDYVFRLRGMGVPIETIREPLPDGTRIGRYRLSERVVALNGLETGSNAAPSANPRQRAS